MYNTLRSYTQSWHSSVILGLLICALMTPAGSLLIVTAHQHMIELWARKQTPTPRSNLLGIWLLYTAVFLCLTTFFHGMLLNTYASILLISLLYFLFRPPFNCYTELQFLDILLTAFLLLQFIPVVSSIHTIFYMICNNFFLNLGLIAFTVFLYIKEHTPEFLTSAQVVIKTFMNFMPASEPAITALFQSVQAYLFKPSDRGTAPETQPSSEYTKEEATTARFAV